MVEAFGSFEPFEDGGDVGQQLHKIEAADEEGEEDDGGFAGSVHTACYTGGASIGACNTVGSIPKAKTEGTVLYKKEDASAYACQ